MERVQIWDPTKKKSKLPENTIGLKKRTFDWYYDEPEQSYVVEGEAGAMLDDGTVVSLVLRYGQVFSWRKMYVNVKKDVKHDKLDT